MPSYNESAVVLGKPTLSFSGYRAYVFQVVLISAAVVLPVVAHLSGISVRFLLPMHWPVILAGLVYGWRAGVLTGALAPIVNYLISGYPLPVILPSMTVELLTYGLATGILREVFRQNPFVSVAIALVFGRIVFIGSVLLGNVIAADHLGYFQAALTPGMIAGLLQIALLPFLAKWWIRQETRTMNEG
jgi:niacin transporter